MIGAGGRCGKARTGGEGKVEGDREKWIERDEEKVSASGRGAEAGQGCDWRSEKVWEGANRWRREGEG